MVCAVVGLARCRVTRWTTDVCRCRSTQGEEGAADEGSEATPDGAT